MMSPILTSWKEIILAGVIWRHWSWQHPKMLLYQVGACHCSSSESALSREALGLQIWFRRQGVDIDSKYLMLNPDMRRKPSLSLQQLSGDSSHHRLGTQWIIRVSHLSHHKVTKVVWRQDAVVTIQQCWQYYIIWLIHYKYCHNSWGWFLISDNRIAVSWLSWFLFQGGVTSSQWYWRAVSVTAPVCPHTSSPPCRHETIDTNNCLIWSTVHTISEWGHALVCIVATLHWPRWTLQHRQIWAPMVSGFGTGFCQDSHCLYFPRVNVARSVELIKQQNRESGRRSQELRSTTIR